MPAALRALTISGRGPKRTGSGNVSSRISKELNRLSPSPFEPQFGPAPEFVAPEFVAPERPDFQTSRQVPFASELDEAIAGIRGRDTATSAGELAGLEGLFEAADPTLRLQKAQDFINQIVGPRNEAAAIKAGFGRGPAALEATTRAGAELALPIVTEAGRQKSLANQFKVALEQARFSREQSQQRDLLDSVLNKVQAGISIESLNPQERSVLAQFNLSSAGSESQFNLSAAGSESQFGLAGAELQSNREIARSNIGLSTADRTLALLNQLRAIRTSQAQINTGLAGRGGSRGGGGTSGLSAPPEISALDRAKTNLFNTQSEAARVASIRAGKVVPPQGPVNLPGVLTGPTGPSTAGSGVIFRNGSIVNAPSVSKVAAGPIFGPPKPSRKPLNPSASGAPLF